MRQDDYRKIKDEVIFQDKYLLKKKVDYSDLKMPKRTNEEKKFMKQIVALLKETKKK